MDVVTVSEPAGRGEGDGLSSVFLQQNHPNPFSGATRVRFYLPEAEPVSLAVYDVSGRRVRRLVERTVDAGWHDVPWAGDTDTGGRAASGVYFCRLEANGYNKAVIMQLVR
jgi:hypothetical protein